jgi:hypothetical protein
MITHHALDCPKKAKVQNMFQTKLIITTTIVAKNLKLDNVLVNVVDVVMTHNQVPKQWVFRKNELVKAKTITD